VSVRHANYYFVGARGAGKTHLALFLAQTRARVLFVDPTSGQTATYTSYDVDRLIASTIDRPGAYDAVWTCGHLDDDAIREGIARIIRAMERSGEQETIIIDELAVIAPNRKHMKRPLRAARLGRHARVSVWLLSQRAVDASPDWRGVMDRIFIFRQHEAADLEALKRINRELPAIVSTLPDRKFVNYDLTDGCFKVAGPV
jgi:hypothetical protein